MVEKYKTEGRHQMSEIRYQTSEWELWIWAYHFSISINTVYKIS